MAGLARCASLPAAVILVGHCGRLDICSVAEVLICVLSAEGLISVPWTGSGFDVS